MKTWHKVIMAICIVLLLLPTFAVFSLANDIDLEGQALTQVATPASNIESIKIGVADGLNDGVSTFLEIDYANILRTSDIDYYTIEYQFTEGDRLFKYDVTVYSNRVAGYLKNSIYTALRFVLSKWEYTENGFVFSGYVPIKTIDLTYKMHVIHSLGQAFNRPYDGNVDATLGIVDPNALWYSRLTFRTSAQHYRSYSYESGSTFSYSQPTENISSATVTHSNASVNDPKYIPVGVRYNNSLVVQPTYYEFIDGVRHTRTVPELYRYSLVTEASQNIEFQYPYTGQFTITDMFTPSTQGDYEIMSSTGSPPAVESQFDVGRMLRNSVQSFLELQIAPNFTLQNLVWVLVGIGAIFALIAVFAGK